MDPNFPELPVPPYTVVIFSSKHSGKDTDGYQEMAQWMIDLVEQQPGYLGMFTARGEQGFGVTVSYWADREAAAAWRQVAEHQSAQDLGRRKWYSQFRVQVCEVRECHDGP